MGPKKENAAAREGKRQGQGLKGEAETDVITSHLLCGQNREGDERKRGNKPTIRDES